MTTPAYGTNNRGTNPGPTVPLDANGCEAVEARGVNPTRTSANWNQTPPPSSGTPTPGITLSGTSVGDSGSQASEHLKSERIVANEVARLNNNCPSGICPVPTTLLTQSQSIPIAILIPDILSQLKTRIEEHNVTNSPNVQFTVAEAQNGSTGLDGAQLICTFNVANAKSTNWHNIQLTHSDEGLYLLFQRGNESSPLSRTNHIRLRISGPEATPEEAVNRTLGVLTKVETADTQPSRISRGYLTIRESSNWLAEVINNPNIIVSSASFLSFKNPHWTDTNFKHGKFNDIQILGFGNVSIELEGATLTNFTIEKGITLKTINSNNLVINGSKSSWECKFAKGSTLEGTTIELHQGRFWCDGLGISNMRNLIINSDNFKKVFSQSKVSINPIKWASALFRVFYDVGWFNYETKARNNRSFKFDMHVAERDLAGQSTLDLLSESSGPLTGHAMQRQTKTYTPSTRQLHSFSQQFNAALNQLTRSEVEAIHRYLPEINPKTDSVYKTTNDELVVLHRTNRNSANVAIYQKNSSAWKLGDKTANLTLSQAHSVLVNTISLRQVKQFT